MRRWQHVAAIGLAWVIVPIAGFAVLEGAVSVWLLVGDVRAFSGDRPPATVQGDTLTGWNGKSGFHAADMFGPGLALTMDDRGVRQSGRRAGGEPGVRMICSGDRVFGWGVGDSQTTCARLQEKLPGLETVNLSQPDFSVAQTYLMARRDAAINPSQVHLFSFNWADIERLSARPLAGYARPSVAVTNDTIVARPTPGSPSRFSRRWEAISRNVSSLRLSRLLDRFGGNEAGNDSALFQVFDAVVRDLHRLCRANGSHLVLAYLPTAADLVPGAGDKRRDRIAAIARAASIPFFDLTEEMRSLPADSSQWLFITANQLRVAGASGQYSARGHLWTATALATKLAGLPAFARSRRGGPLP